MKLETFFEQLFKHLGLELLGVVATEQEDNVLVTISLDESSTGLAIGTRARGIDAIQHLTRVIFGKQFVNKRIFVDINNYREERKSKLKSLLDSIAQEVIKNGEPSMINQFLSSSERFFVHKSLTDDSKYQGLESYSVGDGVGRRVVVQLKKTTE